MKRPCVIAAVIVLSGLVCGIIEAPFIIKVTAILFMAALILKMKSGLSEKDAPLFLFLVGLISLLFLVGFFRGAFESRRMHSAESMAFFEKYEATNPGQFDYAMYLKGMGICSQEQYDSRKNQDPGESPLMQGLYFVRQSCGAVYDSCLSAHDAGIYKAVILGDKTEMDGGIRDLYQEAGIAHLLAVSGLHVSLLGTGLYELLRKKMKMRTAAFLASVVMCLYMLMTGASGSTVRAVIMLLFGFAAVLCGRTYDMRTALSAAAIVLMLQHPYQIFAGGFQLSFGAVLAISLPADILVRRLGLLRENIGSTANAARRKRVSKRNRLPPGLRAFLVSAVIQMTLLPIMAYHYFTFPIYGIFLNFAVIPLMTIVVISGLAVLALHLKVLGLAAAAPGHYVLQLYEALSRMSLQLPFATVCMGRPAVWQIMLYYILLGAAFYFITGGRLKRRWMLWTRCALFIASCILTANVIRYHDFKEFRVAVFDVGQGDSILIKDRKCYILVDGGSSSNKMVGERILEPYLLSKGITKLDMVIVSHIDQDHTNGIQYLLQEADEIQIDHLVLPKAAEKDIRYRELLDAFAERNQRTAGNASVRYASDNMILVGKQDFALRCIYEGCAGEDSNRHSQVLLLQKKNFSMLFTGDTSGLDEALFCEKTDWIPSGGITVLKAAHHGSSTANSEELLRAARPRYAVISCGKNNRYGHPHKEVVERMQMHGIQLLETKEDGCIQLCP